MVKKINKYLKENHPLLWNTRAVWVIGILIAINLLFFAIGFFSINQMVDLQKMDLESSYFTSSWVWVGILASILVFILWLNQYFKQNAFKSFYPKSNLSLAKEFIIILIISFLNVSYYLSYTEGTRQKISSFKTTEELAKDIETFNRIIPFTLQDEYQYKSDRRLPVPAFDTLVSRNEVLQLYVEDGVENGRIAKEYLNNIQVYNDSLPEPYYSTQEFNYLLADHFGRIYSNNETYGKYDRYNNTIIPSLYNFNYDSYYYWISQENQEYQNNNIQQTHNLLLKNQKDSIEYLMAKFIKLADEYQVGYRFKKKPWIDYVYNPPYYFVEGNTLRETYVYDDILDKTVEQDYIAASSMDNALENIYESKKSILCESQEAILILSYLALGFTLLIYTFKVTSLRTWVIALVGTIILGFTYSALFFLLNFTLPIISLSEEGIAISIFYSFLILFITFTFKGIIQQKRKTITGVNLNWLLWSITGIIPLIIATILLYLKNLEKQLYYDDDKYTPLYEFLEDHWIEILSINLILSIIFILMMIPIIKKWKAMPEE